MPVGVTGTSTFEGEIDTNRFSFLDENNENVDFIQGDAGQLPWTLQDAEPEPNNEGGNENCVE